jgi:hypothetical protein
MKPFGDNSLDKKLSPEEKVKIAVNMSDVCVRICAEGIRDQHKSISQEKLIEEVRKRIAPGRLNPSEV